MNWIAVPDSVWSALPFVGGVLAMIAGAMLALGMRGRAIGWQPTCRRCRHDLRGLDPATRQCPECGTNLTRRGAVTVGVRRSAPMMLAIGFAVLALAGYTMWRLQEPKVTILRLQLVSRMSTNDLVAAVFDSRTGPTPSVAEALHMRIEGTGATPRTAPSGELLDALLHAIAQSAKPGRRPAADALASQPVRRIIRCLDDEELLQLAEHAAREVLDSGGSRRVLLDLFLDAASSSPRRGAPTAMAVRQDRWVAHFAGLLRETTEGRELLRPRPRPLRPAPSGSPLLLETYTTLELPGQRGVYRDGFPEDPIEHRFVFDHARLVGDPQRTLFPLSPPSNFHREYADELVALLADLPPGPAQIDLYGVEVPSEPQPPSRRSGPAPPITFNDARASEHAVPAVHRVDIVITEPAPPWRSPTPVTDPQRIEHVASRLRQTRMSNDGRGHRLMVDDVAWSDAESSNPWFTLRATVVQGTQRHDLSHIAGYSHLFTGGTISIPETIDPYSPFDLVLSPDLPAAHSNLRLLFSSEARPSKGLLWSTFVMHFQSADSAPTVTAEVLPITSSTAFAVDTPVVRSELQRYGSTLLNVLNPARRNRRATLGAQLRLPPLATPGAALPELPLLCGHFGARAGGRLIAARATWIGFLHTRDGEMLLHVLANVPEDQTITIRYLPDPEVGTAFWHAPFEYLAVPFELHLDPAEQFVTLVLLDSGDAATSAATSTE